MTLAAAWLAMLAQAPAEGAPDPLFEAARAMPRAPRSCAAAPAEDEEIVVCGRRDNEKYRLPIREGGFDPKGEVRSVSRERNALFQEGDAGIGSCSTVGPGGWTGCGTRDFKRRLEQEGK